MSDKLEAPVRKAIKELKAIDAKLRMMGRELVLLRFDQGKVLESIVKNAQYGKGTVSRIAEETDQTLSTLYRAFHLAEAFQFDKKSIVAALDQWEEESRRITWAKFEHEYLNMKDPNVFGGKEEAAQHFLGQAEQAAHSLEQAENIVGQTDEVHGTAMMVAESIVSYNGRQQDVSRLPFPWKFHNVWPEDDERTVVIHRVHGQIPRVRVGSYVCMQLSNKQMHRLFRPDDGDIDILWDEDILRWMFESETIGTCGELTGP